MVPLIGYLLSVSLFPISEMSAIAVHDFISLISYIGCSSTNYEVDYGKCTFGGWSDNAFVP